MTPYGVDEWFNYIDIIGGSLVFNMFYTNDNSCQKLFSCWSGGRLNIKMSYQYMDPHVKDKTVLRRSYL